MKRRAAALATVWCLAGACLALPSSAADGDPVPIRIGDLRIGHQGLFGTLSLRDFAPTGRTVLYVHSEYRSNAFVFKVCSAPVSDGSLAYLPTTATALVSCAGKATRAIGPGDRRALEVTLRKGIYKYLVLRPGTVGAVDAGYIGVGVAVPGLRDGCYERVGTTVRIVAAACPGPFRMHTWLPRAR